MIPKSRLKIKNLLVIAPHYRYFIKDQIEKIAEYWKHIYVMYKYKTTAELLRFIPLYEIRHQTKEYQSDLSNIPRNVTIIPIPIFNFPTGISRSKIGEKNLRASCKIIWKRKITFDIVHSHFAWPTGYVGVRISKEFGVPFIVTGHGSDIYSFPFRDICSKKRVEYVLNSANTIITVSKRNLKCIKKMGIKTNVHIIPNGFNEDIFYPMDKYKCRKELNLPLEKDIILTVGNLVKVKGHRQLIKAMVNISKLNKNVLCIIIGAGNLERSLRKQVKESGLEEYVWFMGARAHSEIPLWMNACDLFVLPSLDEGNPTVMFECLACGKPFIGTMVGGIPDVIVQEKTGLLIHSSNIEEIVNAIIKGLHFDWDREAIAKYSLKFTSKSMCERIIPLYLNLID